MHWKVAGALCIQGARGGSARRSCSLRSQPPALNLGRAADKLGMQLVQQSMSDQAPTSC